MDLNGKQLAVAWVLAILVVIGVVSVAHAQSGACCNPTTGVCTITSPACCPPGSVYQGDNTVCDPNPCGGACCNNTTGACSVVVNAAACASGSTFTAGATCTNPPCGRGACCNNTTGACSLTTAAGCTAGT